MSLRARWAVLACWQLTVLILALRTDQVHLVVVSAAAALITAYCWARKL